MGRYHRDADAHLPALERHLAGAGVPRLEHRGRARRRDGADAADPGRARPVRHAGADRRDRARRRAVRSRARCSTAATRRTSRRRRTPSRRPRRSSEGWHELGSRTHFVVPFERSFDAHYGLEYLEPGARASARAGRRDRCPPRRRRDRAERRVRGDRRVAGLDRDRRRGRPGRACPVRAEQRHATSSATRATGCWRRSPAAARAARCEWIWDVEIGPPGGAATRARDGRDRGPPVREETGLRLRRTG